MERSELAQGGTQQAKAPASNSSGIASVSRRPLTGRYSQVVTAALDRHAPLKSRVITIRPRAPWYTEEIAEAKKARRRAERRWRRTKESDDRLIYVNLCKSVNAILHHAKSNYYTTVVSDNKGCLLYTSPSPRDGLLSRMPSSA